MFTSDSVISPTPSCKTFIFTSSLEISLSDFFMASKDPATSAFKINFNSLILPALISRDSSPIDKTFRLIDFTLVNSLASFSSATAKTRSPKFGTS